MASSLGARQAARIRTALAGVAVIGVAWTLAAIAACHKPKRDRLRWAIGVATFDATALGLASARSPDPLVDAIRPGRLTIPTYGGSNQATHPDVLRERAASGAPHLTMVMTPYPFSDRRFENPSLLVSDQPRPRDVDAVPAAAARPPGSGARGRVAVPQHRRGRARHARRVVRDADPAMSSP